MAYDALAELRSGGNPVDQLSQAQRDVLSALSPAEVSTINSVKSRLEAASDDVEGHAAVIGGVIF